MSIIDIRFLLFRIYIGDGYMKKERNSNFELLRIISILMVILSHLCLFSGIVEKNSIMSIQSILFSSLRIGVIANYIFIIITGFFMINSEVKYEKIISLILETLLYSISIFVILKMFGIIEINAIQMIKSFFPMFFGNWFVIYYILLYLLIPYLNKFIKNISKKEFTCLLVLLLFLNFIIPTFTNNIWNYTYHDFFITAYFIGTYIKLYCEDKFKNNKKIILLIILGCSFGIFSVFIMQYFGNSFGITSFINKPEYFIRNSYSIYPLFMALLFVLLFRNIKIKNSKIINYISASTLGIYLIHENFLMRDLIWKKIFIIDFNSGVINILLFALVKVVIVFILCLFIDKIRILLFGNIIEKLSVKLKDFFSEIINRFLVMNNE